MPVPSKGSTAFRLLPDDGIPEHSVEVVEMRSTV